MTVAWPRHSAAGAAGWAVVGHIRSYENYQVHFHALL
jgi:hypothetical protein